jgi:hypothetical protein
MSEDADETATKKKWGKDLQDPVIGFGTSEQVASFLLYEAFRYAHEAAAYEVAGDLFGERIQSIDPEPGWQPPAMPTTLSDWLSQRNKLDEKILDPVTLTRLAEAWQSAQRDSRPSARKILKTQRLRSISDVVGHVINLGTCIEAVINRHLFHLREAGKLDSDHYLMLDRTEGLPKILFCFKEEIGQKTLHISRLKYLVSLRNRAVHFKTTSAGTLAPTCQDLLGVWKDTESLFALVKGEPSQEYVRHLVTHFTTRWLKS